MPSTFFSAFTQGATVFDEGFQLFKLGADQSVTQWTDFEGSGSPDPGFNPLDLTEFNGAVWFEGFRNNVFTMSKDGQLYKLGNDGSVTKWTDVTGPPGDGLFTPLLPQADFTTFNNALWFNGNTQNEGTQLYKLGADGSVTKWTALNMSGGGLDPINLTDFNNALWFNGTTPTQGAQLYKLGNDGSVTLWTALNTGGGGLQPSGFQGFSNALWFNGVSSVDGQQLYKLGFDGSVTKWTSLNASGGGLNPKFETEFNGALWFTGQTANGNQLYKLGNDGSVTKWTDMTNFDPGLNLTNVESFTNFNNAMWFEARSPNAADGGFQLYKLGFDGSVTKWTAINTSGIGLDPSSMFVFANALWFNGNTADGRQLFKQGADGSVTKWTDIAGGFDPQLVSAGASDPDSTPSSIFQNAAWLSGSNAANGGTELYKLGADGSVTFWKDINPGPPSSFPHDWARFA